MRIIVSVLRYVLTGLVTFLAFTSAHAQDPTFGRTDVGAITSSGLSADFKRGSRFTLSEPATVHSLCAYVDGYGGTSGQQYFRLAMYADSAGRPGTKVLESSHEQLRAGDPAGWRCPLTHGYTPIAPGEYWIVIHSAGTAGVIRYYYDGPANWFGNADSYADGASNPFGAGNSGSGTLSVHAVYFAQSLQGDAGRTTVGTLPSNGMSGEFKRASSFTLAERGRLSAMTAYLDGLGGVSGMQQIRYVLYRDANGVPGTKITETYAPSYLKSGLAPGWITSQYVTPELLDPGRYWIALHTSGPSGVLRNYADGTGNWYGNADTYSDGASSPFGTANAGNGTLSAFISYDRREMRLGQMGRTTVATVPSKGLTANMMRGSEFIYNNSSSVLHSVSAYLDGLGAAAGSQRIRMSVYQVEAIREQTAWTRIAESEEVTIAAGRPPGWVTFPVRAAPLYHGIPVFRIMIESGDTAGVVRTYGDGSANWVGKAITYAEGGPNQFMEDGSVSYGTVTLSVYGTYSEPVP
jgi:hypothetical protein